MKNYIKNIFKVFTVSLLLIFTVTHSSVAQVKASEVEWGGVGCYKIEMPTGTVYFEKDNGVSGFKSFVDPEGNDWIASNMEPGPHGEWRGFPNCPGNFGHAGRTSNSQSTFVDNKMEGEFIILESSNDVFTFQYWFFPTHIAIKVLKSQGDYHFLYEGVPGGTADATDFFITADGKKHIPTQDGEFDDFTPEWFYIGDEDNNNYLFLAKTPNDDAPNENHRQIIRGQHNMDLYSFGRTGHEHKYKTMGMSGNEHSCLIGFIRTDKGHKEISEFISGLLKNPFNID